MSRTLFFNIESFLILQGCWTLHALMHQFSYRLSMNTYPITWVIYTQSIGWICWENHLGRPLAGRSRLVLPSQDNNIRASSVRRMVLLRFSHFMSARLFQVQRWVSRRPDLLDALQNLRRLLMSIEPGWMSSIIVLVTSLDPLVIHQYGRTSHRYPPRGRWRCSAPY